LADQHRTLCRKLRGHYQYFGIIGQLKNGRPSDEMDH
jgi:hypothetical protein